MIKGWRSQKLKINDDESPMDDQSGMDTFDAGHHPIESSGDDNAGDTAADTADAASATTASNAVAGTNASDATAMGGTSKQPIQIPSIHHRKQSSLIASPLFRSTSHKAIIKRILIGKKKLQFEIKLFSINGFSLQAIPANTQFSVSWEIGKKKSGSTETFGVIADEKNLVTTSGTALVSAHSKIDHTITCKSTLFIKKGGYKKKFIKFTVREHIKDKTNNIRITPVCTLCDSLSEYCSTDATKAGQTFQKLVTYRLDKYKSHPHASLLVLYKSKEVVDSVGDASATSGDENDSDSDDDSDEEAGQSPGPSSPSTSPPNGQADFESIGMDRTFAQSPPRSISLHMQSQSFGADPQLSTSPKHFDTQPAVAMHALHSQAQSHRVHFQSISMGAIEGSVQHQLISSSNARLTPPPVLHNPHHSRSGMMDKDVMTDETYDDWIAMQARLAANDAEIQSLRHALASREQEYTEFKHKIREMLQQKSQEMHDTLAAKDKQVEDLKQALSDIQTQNETGGASDTTGLVKKLREQLAEQESTWQQRESQLQLTVVQSFDRQQRLQLSCDELRLTNQVLQQQLQNLQNLQQGMEPGAGPQPLSEAEREYMTEIERRLVRQSAECAFIDSCITMRSVQDATTDSLSALLARGMRRLGAFHVDDGHFSSNIALALKQMAKCSLNAIRQFGSLQEAASWMNWLRNLVQALKDEFVAYADLIDPIITRVWIKHDLSSFEACEAVLMANEWSMLRYATLSTENNGASSAANSANHFEQFIEEVALLMLVLFRAASRFTKDTTEKLATEALLGVRDVGELGALARTGQLGRLYVSMSITKEFAEFLQMIEDDPLLECPVFAHIRSTVANAMSLYANDELVHLVCKTRLCLFQQCIDKEHHEDLYQRISGELQSAMTLQHTKKYEEPSRADLAQQLFTVRQSPQRQRQHRQNPFDTDDAGPLESKVETRLKQLLQ